MYPSGAMRLLIAAIRSSSVCGAQAVNNSVMVVIPKNTEAIVLLIMVYSS